jgi:hypothetical protein
VLTDEGAHFRTARIELALEEHGSSLQDLVRAAQLEVLLPPRS